MEQNEGANLREKTMVENKELIISGDATLDLASGVGYFEKIAEMGNKNGFSYSGLNMSFASAKDETERSSVARNIAEFSRSLSIPEDIQTITIIPNFLKGVGKTVFIGKQLPNFIKDVSLVSAESVPSLKSAYPQDKDVTYPGIIDQEADIVITSTPGINLQILSRDCITAIIVVKKPGLYLSGLMHAGWRQVDGLVGSRLVRDLTAGESIDPKDLKISIAPCLRKERAVLEHLGGISNESLWLDFIEKKDDGYHLDFVNLFKKQLLEEGVPEENILDCQIDTYDAQIQGVGHSARLQREKGLRATRMMTAVQT